MSDDRDKDYNNSGSSRSSSNNKVSLSFGITKKKKRNFVVEKDDEIAKAFGGANRAVNGHETSLLPAHEPPLVIPVAANKYSLRQAVKVKVADDMQAAPDLTTSSSTASATNNHDDKTELPDAPDVDSESFARVPVHQFGAAMLRGMGWSGKDNNNNNNTDNINDDSTALPRPHRLGLGAIPKLPNGTAADNLYAPTHSKQKPRRPDQVQRDQALQAQQQEFQQELQRQRARDKQVTMQNGSIVFVDAAAAATGGSGDNDDRRDHPNLPPRETVRAKVIKLVGVPGLNRVQIQREGCSEYDIIQRRHLMGLVDRQLLEDRPFVQVAADEVKPFVKDEDGSERRRQKDQGNGNRRGEDQTGGDNNRTGSSRRDYRDDDRKSRRQDRDGNGSGAADKDWSYKRLKLDTCVAVAPSNQWITSHIRVRVVTEKLGRKHFRQKGVVIDVTPKGATIRMDGDSSTRSSNNNTHAVIFDRVPERYLETALPKSGGKAIVVARSHGNYMAKGILLERNSQKGRGVIQLQEDMAVVTLSLDDIAEWCGPLDDDEGHH